MIQPSPFSYEIRIFLNCAKSSTFVEAAYNSGLQQSSITKIIKKLEDEFEKKLFIRSSKGIVLTDYGKQLNEMYIQTINFWESMYFKKLNQETNFVGEMSIGCHHSIAMNELAKFYPYLSKQYPRLRINTHLDTSINITKAILDYKIDIGLVINPVKNQDLVVKPIHKEFVAFWGDKAAKTIIYNPQMYSQAQLIKKFKNAELMPIDNYEVIATLTKTSKYKGLLPNTVASRYNLKQASDVLMTTQLSMIYNKYHLENNFKSKVAKSILQMIKS
ncbi:MAG: LysR family transcriptional regulator [Bdellovibrionales bacterium]|nr:LysR family transcriptional regulator [Bdellovibrionales bacterium]